MAAIVGFVLIWPVAHGALVRAYRIDPWELFGWSMYALPAARVQIRVELERGGERSPLRAMGETRRRLLELARRRTALGSLASLEPFARELLDRDPTVDAVILVTREILLDRESDRLSARDRVHRFERRST